MRRPLTLAALLLALAALPARPADAQVRRGPVRAAAAMTAPTDAQILHVFITGNRGEVLTNGVGVERAQNAELRTYNQRMVTEHTAVVQRLEALGRTERIVPANNLVSGHLERTAAATADKLRALSGMAHDMMQMDVQVHQHMDTLDLLDHTLIPNARNARLRAMLTEIRGNVQQHTDHAKTMQKTMMAAMR